MPYISREKVLNRLRYLCEVASEPPMDWEDKLKLMVLQHLKKEFAEIPTADVEEVKHGEWIRGGIWGDTGSVEYKCSVCRETTYDADLLPRCPQCGAKMDGGNEE